MNLGINKKRGFGILEVLLSGVIIITMLGALVFAAKAIINNTLYSQQRAQASFIAQDGIESLRQIRDSNYIDGRSGTKWNTFTGDTSNFVPEIGKQYCLRKNFNSRNRYHLVECTDIEIDQERSGMVKVDDTIFFRYISFSKIGNKLIRTPEILDDDGQIVRVTDSALIAEVKVNWIYNGQDKELIIEELIADSRQAW